MKSETVEWKCAGCGKPSPDLRRNCDCPTGVLYAKGQRSIWKIEPGSAADWEDRAQAAEAEVQRLTATLEHVQGHWREEVRAREQAEAKSARLSALMDQAREVVEELARAVARLGFVKHAREVSADFLTRLSKTGGEGKQELSVSRTSPSSPDSRRPERLSDLEGELLAALKALLADSYPVGCDENMDVREQAIAAVAKAEHQQ